ncbi:MAG TPA: 23S rRNA (pseudouridine(1915)-N(3))-methyltransferase RlmH [Caulobacteraceae bacterium]|nr:23S rRNA (pseudouridine(1915)-N(3))-methyltransferase RlmH [Caulobacteraceae bacterium]
MKITLLCVGRLGEAPESRLAGDWAARATAIGRALGLGPVEIAEVEGRKGGKAAEADAILPRLEGAHVIACDEHGQGRTSREFAALIGRLRDDGVRRLALVIGGADGLDERVLSMAQGRLAFGTQTWPHALVRAMLAEQVYRAATILAGTPYHRD